MQRLARQIPLKQAMHLRLTGRIFGTTEALALGVINEIVPEEGLTAAANRLVASTLESAPLAVRATKQATIDGLAMPLAEAMATRHPAVDAMERGPACLLRET